MPNGQATIKDVTDRSRSRGHGRQLFWGAVLVGGALILSSVLAGRARSVGNSPYSSGHHWGRSSADLSPEDLQEKTSNVVNVALRRIDASDEQRRKIKSILNEAAPDMLAFQRERQALVDRFIKAVEAERMSPDELASIRAVTVRLVERASDRSIDTVCKVAEVLTPEQRKKLVETLRRGL